MSLFLFLTVVQALVAAALVGVILMQRSEGGGLGVGGSPSGLMSARGAADFLTRATAVLATAFVVLSIVLAALAVGATSGRKLDTSLNRTVTGAPISADPLAGAAQSASPAPLPIPVPIPADPLAGQTRAVAPRPTPPQAKVSVAPTARPVRAKVTAVPKASPSAAQAPAVSVPAPSVSPAPVAAPVTTTP